MLLYASHIGNDNYIMHLMAMALHTHRLAVLHPYMYIVNAYITHRRQLPSLHINKKHDTTVLVISNQIKP
jgi:hypothetical protein